MVSEHDVARLNEYVPTFCRHNRLIQNCPICAREQEIELRPIVSRRTPTASAAGASPERAPAARSRARSSSAGSRSGGGVRVSKLARGVDDGYGSPLAPGLKSSADAERLAEELAFAVARLVRLEVDPPGLYAEVADESADIEERTWLAFLIDYIGPREGEDPFGAIEPVRTSWAGGEPPDLAGVQTGPRTAHDPSRGVRTLEAYRAWAARAGSQAAAFTGEQTWSAERRFARAFERLSLPGLDRGARFDLLVTLGRLGVYDLRAGSLQFGGANEVTLAAKRVFGIGDPLLLERRAADLASASELPLGALDLGLHNWGTGTRVTLGLEPSAEPDPDALGTTRAALELG
jgi:hypothetical protein